VFIVEDSEMVRGNLKTMLTGIPGVDLVGYAVDEESAVARIDTLLPEVVILDLHLQAGSGLNVLERIKKDGTAPKVIVLINYATEPYVSRCKQLGADYIFDKSFQFMSVKTVLEQLISH